MAIIGGSTLATSFIQFFLHTTLGQKCLEYMEFSDNIFSMSSIRDGDLKILISNLSQSYHV